MSDPEVIYESYGNKLIGAGATGGGGHSIIDSEGNTMPQEENLQFVGLKVTDDSTNSRTIVDATDKVTWKANGVLGAKNLIPYPYYEKNYSNNGVVWTCEEEGTISVTGTATARDYFNLTVGINRNDGQAVAEKDKFNISALVGKTVILSLKVSEVGSNSTFGWGYCVRDSSSTNIASANIYNSNSVAITIPDNAVYMDIFAEVFSGATVSGITFTEPMLRLAEDTDSTYQPYAETNYQLTHITHNKLSYKDNGILGAKNLIPYPYYETTKTVNGVTFTDNGDGTITVNGTATSKVNFWLEHYSLPFIYPNGSYLLSDGGVGSSDVTLFFAYYNGTTWVTQSNVFDNGEIPIIVSHSASSDYDRTPIGINVRAGATVSNLTFKPMLRLAEDTDSTYQPYAKTNKELTDELKGKVDWVTNGKLGAKNLIPYPYPLTFPQTNHGITFTDDNGVIETSGTQDNQDVSIANVFNAWGTSNSVKLEPNTKYIISGCPSGGSASSYYLQPVLTDSSNNHIWLSEFGDELEFTTDSTHLYLGLRIGIAKGYTGQSLVFKPMLRLASDTDRTYQPYAMTNQEITKKLVSMNDGHVIENESGVDLTQRDTLQFKGMTVTDDATNGKTVVEATKTSVGLGNVDNTADNNKPVPIVECSTARSTAAKVVALTGFTLKTGSHVYVRFTDTGKSNPASGNLTLNVNGTGAKTIVDGKTNKSVLTYSSAGWFYNNIVSEFVYDGTYWVWMSRDNNTTYTPQALGIGYGTCTTAAATVAKAATLSGYVLVTNGTVAIKFTNAVPANATLAINGKTAKAIYYRGAAITAGIINAGDTATFFYNGSQYHLIAVDNVEKPTFTEASTRANIASGETLTTILGKIKKFFTDLKAVAFSGSASDVDYSNSQSGLSATKVQGAIDEVQGEIANIADSGIWHHTVTATEATDSTIYVSPQAIKAGAKKIIPTGCVIDSQNKPCVYDNANNVFIIFGMKQNDVVAIYFVAIM